MEVESYKQHQIFKQTIDRFAQALPGGYRGSRKVAMRYIYPRTTLANFIELNSEEPPMRPAEFVELLSAVPGVLTVVMHPKTKAEQNNYGDHYQERNVLVYSQMYPEHGMEFELTTYNHEKNWSTISACYKTQFDRPRAMEAWRILQHSGRFRQGSGRFRKGFGKVSERFRKGFGKFRKGFGKVAGRFRGCFFGEVSGRFREGFGEVSGECVCACVRAKIG